MEERAVEAFERNRYYWGKMLTSGDFQTEQDYMNQKRRFLNRMVLGKGLLCGMQAVNLDDLSVLVESGAAVDGRGREIVLRESRVLRIAALEGYEERKSNELTLCVRYHEEGCRPAYVINRREGQREYEENHICESCVFFLRDRKREEGPLLDSEFFVEAPLFSSGEYEARLKMPAAVSVRSCVRMELLVKKCGEGGEALELSFGLQFPLFCGMDGRREVFFQEQFRQMRPGEIQTRELWLRVPDTGMEETHIICIPGSAQAAVGARREAFGETFDMRVRITGLRPEELAREILGRSSLELRGGETDTDAVELAQLRLAETAAAVVIEALEPCQGAQYLELPRDAIQRRTCLSYFREPEGYGGPGDGFGRSEETGGGKAAKDGFQIRRGVKAHAGDGGSAAKEDRGARQTEQKNAAEIREGILEIPLEPRMRRGKCAFSEEIIHGLGPGNVYVAAGLMDREETGIIYGDSRIFSEGLLKSGYETAVQVFPERGSFRAAVRLTGEQDTVLVRLRWTAVAAAAKEAKEARPEKSGGGRITSEVPTVRLKPKEKWCFRARFHQMEPCRICYELTDGEGGRIEPDGTYTAPARPGVYEICMYCEGQPQIRAYAYAVVQREL